MPFDGSGNYNRNFPPGGWQGDAAANIKIKADRHDQHDGDIATALSNTICKDGQSSPSADIGFNSKKIINLANPVNPQDAATKNYVDGIRQFSSAISITGSTPESRLKYTGSTGPWGDSYVTADLAFGAKAPDTWVWNDKADFTGTDIMKLDAALTSTLTLASIDTGAGSGPWFYIDRLSPTPVAGDIIGAIGLRGRTSTAVLKEYAGLYSSIGDPTNASEDGNLTIRVTVAGTPTARLLCDAGGVDVTGKLTSSGDFTCGGVVRSATTFFVGTGANIILGPDTGGTSTGILLRPTNYSLSTGTMSISPAGNVSIAGTLVVNGSSTYVETLYVAEFSSGINGTASGCINNAGSLSVEAIAGHSFGKIGSNGANIGIYQGTSACGSITVANGTSCAYNTTSDIRIKTGVKGAENARALVDALQVIEYEPVTKIGEIREVEGVAPGPEVWMGFSAQQVYGVFPTAVAPPTAWENNENYKSDAKAGEEGFVPWMLDYSKFVPMLMANVQELNKRNDALEARLAQLETAA